MPKNIYVASSWKNNFQPLAVTKLREHGYEVYDFRNPYFGEKGFTWDRIWEIFDHDWQNATLDEFVDALKNPVAEQGFNLDFNAMQKADACVMVMPCGNSAHLEAGYFVGAQKPLLIWIPDGKFQVELMYKMASLITSSILDIIAFLQKDDKKW